MREHPALRYLIKRTQKTIKSYYLEDNNYIDSILKEGGEKANIIASKKVEELKRIIGF